IAKLLYISPRTVETHRARVIKKLGFKTTADIIKYAIKTNLMKP
ncbi:MAG: DNA-binding response regulator, partial [Bdellovibrionales bacterium]|nr:DNA-binding response regulator [Bdellovibrionales bacterium]